jgi:hypothetical protein
MKKNLVILTNFVLLIFLILTSCEKKQPVQQKQVYSTKKDVVEVSSATIESPALKKYVYEGLSYRDPFVPLSGEKLIKAKLGLTTEAIVPPLGSLQLKGFIVDKHDKIAMFSSPYGSYLLVNGKLYDNQNRLVKGFSGKIVFDTTARQPQKVILVTENDEYKEYTISK